MITWRKITGMLLTLLLLVSFSTIYSVPVIAGQTSALNGWDKVSNGWTTGNVAGYGEEEWVDFQLEVNDYQGEDGEIIELFHDYFNGTNYGFLEGRGFYIGAQGSAQALPEGDRIAPGAVYSVSAMSITTDGSQIQYNITFNDVAGLSQLKDKNGKLNFSIYWQAKLAGPNESSLWKGASLHSNTSLAMKELPMGKIAPSQPPIPEKGSLVVTKRLSDPDRTAQAGVTFKLHKGTGEDRVTLTDETDSSGLVTFSNLVPGTDYYLEEVVPADHTTDLTPNPQQITINAGANSKTVINTYNPPGPGKGNLVVTKLLSNKTAQAGVIFKLHKGTGEGRVTRTDETDSSGLVTFSDLVPGTDYYLEEVVPANHTTDLTPNPQQITISAGANSKTVINTYNPPPVDQPAISLTKVAAPTAVYVGDTITYTYKVTNTGDYTLYNVSLTDDKLGSISLTDTTLAPEQFTTATATYVAQDSDVGTLTNIATTKGYYELYQMMRVEGEGSFVEATASASVTVSRQSTPPPPYTSSDYPSIKLEKNADLNEVTVGDVITYTYIVTNNGDYTLNNITVSDDKLGSITLGKTSLAPGEKTTGTASYTSQESDLPGPLVNEAKAKGYYSSVSSTESTLVKATVLLSRKPVVVPPEPPVVAPPESSLPYTGGNTVLYVSAGMCLAGLGAFLRRRF